jgi:hypothetical protein
MKYRPGSFSKNFAWHGTGLRKLHTAIRSGFASDLTAVSRERWRSASGIGDHALDLIPINFFLHNAGARLSIDELVFQAVAHAHSLKFDRLGLFALHLTRVGRPPGGVERPAMWANEFVRELFWRDDAWHAAALTDASLDAFIADRMDAQTDVRVKCRNNYRHLFELCGYLPTRLPIINAGSEQWMLSALFLTWDRFVLDNGIQPKTALIDYAVAEELHKLLGLPARTFEAEVGRIADLYFAAGGIERFTAPTPPPALPEIPEETGSKWVQQEETDEAVGRRRRETQAQMRDRRKAAALRQHYDNMCLACGIRLQIGRDQFYVEAAHIKPLGKPHNGPDKTANMIVLCPNHHLQFDSGILRITKKGSDYVLVSKVEGDPLHGRALPLKHPLDDDCVNWHREWFAAKRS